MAIRSRFPYSLKGLSTRRIAELGDWKGMGFKSMSSVSASLSRVLRKKIKISPRMSKLLDIAVKTWRNSDKQDRDRRKKSPKFKKDSSKYQPKFYTKRKLKDGSRSRKLKRPKKLTFYTVKTLCDIYKGKANYRKENHFFTFSSRKDSKQELIEEVKEKHTLLYEQSDDHILIKIISITEWKGKK